MNRKEELDNVEAAFALEQTIVMLEGKREKLPQSRPVPPSKPEAPHMLPSAFSEQPYPEPALPSPKDLLPNYRKDPWEASNFAKAKVCGIGVLVCVGLFIILPNFAALEFFIPSLTNVLTPLRIAVPLVGIACVFLAFIFWAKGYFGGGDTRERLINEQKQKLQQAQQAYIAHTKAQPEYIQTCAAIDEANRLGRARAQELARQTYETELADYNQRLLPGYLKEKALFDNELLPQWEEEMRLCDTALAETRATLEEVYGQNIIPVQFRSLEALTYLAAFMGTSQYDLKFAIERYDKDIDHMLSRQMIGLQKAQIALMGRILENQSYASYLQQETVTLIAQGNDTLKSIKRWNIAQTALEGYLAFSARRAAKSAQKKP